MTYLVWNPARGMPTYAHPTLESAAAEAYRLWQNNPGERFYVMAPVLDDDGARLAKAFGAGKAEGLDEAHRQILKAEARADNFSDRYDDLLREVQAYRKCDAIRRSARKYQAIVADALLWFNGFAAAHALREPWERPSIPDVAQLRELNGRLQEIAPDQSAEFEEIPF